MSEKGPYAPPPNMEAPQGGDYKGPGASAQSAYPQHQAYAHQPGFVPYGFPSTAASPQDQYVPNPDTDPIVKGFEFSSESLRRGFIRKVYAILSVMLSITFVTVMMFTHHQATRDLAEENIWILFVALITVLVSIITLSCCEGVRRTSPTNLIFLAIFTVSESVLVGYSTLRYDRDTVMLAVGATAVVVIALTVFAMQTKWDFTMMGGVLFVGLWLMIMFSFILMFMRSHVAELIFSCFGALLFSAYLIHDTQMIMGGNHKYQMSPEEYILGAIALFLDIINIFLYLLRILGAASKS